MLFPLFVTATNPPEYPSSELDPSSSLLLPPTPPLDPKLVELALLIFVSVLVLQPDLFLCPRGGLSLPLLPAFGLLLLTVDPPPGLVLNNLAKLRKNPPFFLPVWPPRTLESSLFAPPEYVLLKLMRFCCLARGGW